MQKLRRNWWNLQHDHGPDNGGEGVEMTGDKERLLRALAEFFLDSLREDAADVDNWCEQRGDSVDDIAGEIERHLDMKP
ncbi:hypothetical protein LCGC14_2217490 [marine sediment metagenome]|uniref:Uncharacterized protein n=1 Tax=marine sediment metagenome TaxID=412755 RepID=A0A0F9DZG6_9ZZZZ